MSSSALPIAAAAAATVRTGGKRGAPAPLTLPTPVSEVEMRREEAAKRIKLFQAMQESGLGETLPSLPTSQYAAAMQFALAMDRMLQTHLRPRLGGLTSLEEARHVARAALTRYVDAHTDDAELVHKLLVFVDEDARRAEWPPLPASLADEMVDEASVDAPPLATFPCGRMRIVMPQSRALLVEVGGLSGSNPPVTAQRDCIYQTLIFLRGLLARFQSYDPRQRRNDLLKQFREQWPQAREAEAAARARLLERLEAEPAAWNQTVEAAAAALEKAEKEVQTAIDQGEAVRVELDAHFLQPADEADEDVRLMRNEWLQICEQRRQLGARALAKARESGVVRRAALEEARASLAPKTQAHAARLEEARAPLPPQGEMEALVMAHVDAQQARARVVAEWAAGDVRRYDRVLEALAQHEDVLAEAHLTVCMRAQRMMKQDGGARA